MPQRMIVSPPENARWTWLVESTTDSSETVGVCVDRQLLFFNERDNAPLAELAQQQYGFGLKEWLRRHRGYILLVEPLEDSGGKRHRDKKPLPAAAVDLLVVDADDDCPYRCGFVAVWIERDHRGRIAWPDDRTVFHQQVEGRLLSQFSAAPGQMSFDWEYVNPPPPPRPPSFPLERPLEPPTQFYSLRVDPKTAAKSWEIREEALSEAGRKAADLIGRLDCRDDSGELLKFDASIYEHPALIAKLREAQDALKLVDRQVEQDFILRYYGSDLPSDFMRWTLPNRSTRLFKLLNL